MRAGFTRIVLAVGLLVLLAFVAAPYVRSYFFSATAPRTVQSRGDLADFERTTIQLFEQSSPSVVQVVAQRAESAQLGQDFEVKAVRELGPAPASSGMRQEMSSPMRMC